MQSFQLNNKSVRFIEVDNVVYFVTADVNKAFGFGGQNTLFDKMSHSCGDIKPIPTIELPKTTLLIELKDMLLATIRSNKPELKNMQDILSQMLASAFFANFGLQTERDALPPVSDIDRVDLMAKAVCKRYQYTEVPQDKVNLPDWLTVTEMLINLGEDPDKDSGSLVHDNQFRFWINRQMSDVYRAQMGEEAPTVQRHKGSGFWLLLPRFILWTSQALSIELDSYSNLTYPLSL